MTKELYIEAHEELIEEYMKEFPTVTWEQAYDLTADKAYDRYTSKLGDLIDQVRMSHKDG